MYPLVFLTFNDEHHFSRRGITHTIINNALEVSEVFSGYTRYPKIWSAILIVHNRCSSLKIWKINSLPGNSIICHWIAVSSARQCSIFFGVYYDIFTNLYNRCRIYNKNLKILCNWTSWILYEVKLYILTLNCNINLSKIATLRI